MSKKENDISKKGKPLPKRLSCWDSGTEMVYICPRCSTSLGFYGHKQNYCHMCGKKLNWNNCPQYASQEFKQLYDDLHSAKANRQITYMEFKQKLTDLLFKWYKNIIN